ncbi:ATP-binding protein, partial [Vogesella mureinivorans]|uniref:ATP-binding protein n=1 Tax=Vogesella mureinivorans TaxID=657276 RepID=UPI001F0E2186
VSQLPQAAGFRPERRLDRLADLVEVDRVQIEQVLNNLLRNAIEAMATSPVRQLKVGSALAGDMVELWVSDTGPGLSPDARAHLFEPF